MVAPASDGAGDSDSSFSSPRRKAAARASFPAAAPPDANPDIPIKLTVVLKRGKGLLAADKNGFSDPFVKLALGSEQYKSTIVKKSLNPEWNESFHWNGPKALLLGQSIMFNVFDYDGRFSKADRLGDAALPLAQFVLGSPQDVEIPLDTQGTLEVSVMWRFLRDSVVEGKLANVKRDSKKNLLSLGESSPSFPSGDADEPLLLTLRIKKGTNLLVADKNGLSDPFVVLTCNGQRHKSKVVYKTLEPTWDQTFHFSILRMDLLTGVVGIEVRDYDGMLSKSDFLGSAQLDLARNMTGIEKDMTIDLNTQGSVDLSYSWTTMTDTQKSRHLTRGTTRNLRRQDTNDRLYPARFANFQQGGRDREPEVKRKRKRRGFKNRLFGRLQRTLTRKLESLYVDKLKLTITPDRRMPWVMRVAIHEVADEIWDGLKVEVERVFEKMMDQHDDEEEEESTAATVPTPPPSPPDSAEAMGTPASSVEAAEAEVRMLQRQLEVAQAKLRAAVKRASLPSPPASPPDSLPALPKPPRPPPSVRPPDVGFIEMRKHLVAHSVPLATPSGSSLSLVGLVPCAGSSLPESSFSVVDDMSLRSASPSFSGSASPEMSVDDSKAKIEFTLVLKSGFGLMAADSNGLSDPFVRLSLGKKKYKSKVQKMTLDPHWDESFRFQMQKSELQTASIRLECYDYDGLTAKADHLGSASLSLSEFMDDAMKTVSVKLDTQGTLLVAGWWHFVETQSLSMRGRLFSRKPRAKGGERVRLRLNLVEGVGLLAADKGGTSDPYVRFTLMGEKRTSKVQKATLDPIWDEDFTWKVTKPDLQHASLQVAVFDSDGLTALTKDDKIGNAMLALSSFDHEGEWYEVDLALDTQGQIILKIMWEDIVDGRPPRPIEEVLGSEEDWGPPPEPSELKPRVTPYDFFEKLPPVQAFIATKRDFTKIQFEIKLQAAKLGIPNDSDPYVRIRPSWTTQTYKSRTIYNSANPVWEDEFHFTRYVRELEKPLPLDVFEDDTFSADEHVGSAFLDMNEICNRAVLENDPGAMLKNKTIVHKIVLPIFPPMAQEKAKLFRKRRLLSSRTLIEDEKSAVDETSSAKPRELGNLYIEVVIHTVKEPSSEEVSHLIFEPLLKPIDTLRRMIGTWKKNMRFMSVHLKVGGSEGLKLSDLVSRAGMKPHHLHNVFVKCPNCGKGSCNCELTPAIKLRVYHHAELQGHLLEEVSTTGHVGTDSDHTYDVDFKLAGPLASFGPEGKVEIVLPIGRNGHREAVGVLDLDDLAEGPEEHEIEQSMQIPVEVPNPITRKKVKVGKLFVDVKIKFGIAVPSWPEALRVAGQYLISQFLDIFARLPEIYSERARTLNHVEYDVFITRGVDLPASDRNGKSDPYLTLTHADQFFFTTVVPKTVDPVWNEKFTFKGQMGDFRKEPLIIELFDEDELTADDILGFTEVDFRVFDPFSMPDNHMSLSLPFSTKGKVYVDITARIVSRSGYFETAQDFVIHPLTDLFHRLRNFVLYYRNPYDRAIFSKLRDPWTIIVIIVAAHPEIVIRGSFFTFFLICILKDREEFQVMKFILGLKGTQFLSGIIKAILGYHGFWMCLTLEPDPESCRFHGPGVHTNIATQITLLIWTQILLWVAFLVLPYAGVYNPSTGKVVYGRANQLWATNYAAAVRRAAKRRKLAEERESCMAKLARCWNLFIHLLTDRCPSPIDKCGGRCSRLFITLKQVREKLFRLTGFDHYSKLVPETDPETGETLKPEYDTSIWHGRLMDQTWPIRQRMREFILEAPILIDTVTAPLRHASPRNRMVMLLKWDFVMVIVTFFLWMSMYYLSMRTRATEMGLTGDWVTDELNILWLFLTGWKTWQSEITYAIVKVFFALSSAPFFIFTIGGLNKLFTHTEASAYTRNGQIMPLDLYGLSAYLQWLKEDVLGQKRYRNELYDNFPRKKLSQLEKAVAQGEQLLVTAMERPSTALRETRKKKMEIDALLRSIVTREASSDALFQKCFPDMVIVETYLAERQKQTEVKKERKIGEDDSGFEAD